MAEQFLTVRLVASVLFPFGGKYRATPGMVSKLPAAGGKTTTTSGMAHGFDPYLSEQSFHGLLSDWISQPQALGFDYKDYAYPSKNSFENLQNDPERWGKPVLIPISQLSYVWLNLASIGGKDSMSGNLWWYRRTVANFTVIRRCARSRGPSGFSCLRQGSTVVLVENPLDRLTIDLDQPRKSDLWCYSPIG